MEQQARNTLFPEATDSPIVLACTSAICNQLRHVLAFSGCPVAEMTVLQAFLDLVSLEVALAMGPASQGEFAFVEAYPRIPDHDRISAIHQVEVELRAMIPAMVRWRLALSPSRASQWESLTDGLLTTFFELSYFGRFDSIEMLASCFRQFYIKWAEAVDALARDPGPAP